jgi:hypothetical protein
MFLIKADGSVHFLDSHNGELQLASSTYDEWKAELQDEAKLYSWFAPNVIHDLRANSVFLKTGECYSTRHHTILGGEFDAENFEPAPWRAHVFLLGQIHEQVKDLPEGTPISGFDLKWE